MRHKIIKRASLYSLLFFCLFSCKNQDTSKIHEDPNDNIDISNDLLVYTYQDSLDIGEKGKYKLNVMAYRYPSEESDTLLLKIGLSEKEQTNWCLIQTIVDTLQSVSNPDVVLADINGDGYNDMSYQSALAGRGYNVIRKHYVFDKRQKKLRKIVNSDQHPNLNYNKDLDCLESHIAYGGYSSIFLVLEADSLREFAAIDLSDNQRIVEVTNKEGVTTILETIAYDLDTGDADITYGDYDWLTLKKYKDQ